MAEYPKKVVQVPTINIFREEDAGKLLFDGCASEPFP